MNGYIYLIKDHYKNKIYIGQSTNLKTENYFGSGIIIKRILKIRKHHLQKIILGYCETKEELDEAEKICIDHFQSNDKRYGYNLSEGGCNGAGKLNKGKKRSLKTRMKMSLAQIGREPTYGFKNKNHSEFTKQKMKNEATGRKHSPKTKYKLSCLDKKGENNPNYKIISTEAMIEAIELFKNGVSVQQIIKSLNIHRKKLKYIFNEFNIKIRKENNKLVYDG